MPGGVLRQASLRFGGRWFFENRRLQHAFAAREHSGEAAEEEDQRSDAASAADGDMDVHVRQRKESASQRPDDAQALFAAGVFLEDRNRSTMRMLLRAACGAPE